jgi:hypothetical protein
MLYCYEHGDTVITKSFPMGKAPKFVFVGKVRYRRSFRAEHKGIPATSGWPLECYASGVHADQAQELRDFLAKKGVPTDVTPEGNPIYRDANHRKRALKARGLHDNSSYL